MKNVFYTVLTAVLVLALSGEALGQKRIWVSGAARGVMYSDDYASSGEIDTTTARMLQSGHTMVDLGVNIQPNENLYIQGMVRIRNDYGGFWGSGVTFDVRQLYLKGIIGGFLKYQLGDINYKLTPYTFQNHTSLINSQAGVISSVPLEQVRYDLFYTDDQTWRQQGAAVDFGLEFTSVIEEMDFNLFMTRIRPTDFNTIDDRLFGGGSVTITQSKFVKLGAQYVSLFDFSGTSNATVFLRNPVYTGTAELTIPIDAHSISVALETGLSAMEWEGSATAPVLEDYFYDVKAKWNHGNYGLSVELGYKEVGPNFRSPGAQTMRIDYSRNPLAYGRYGNDQNVRMLSMLDLSRDASIYQTQIKAGLMAYDPRYDNVSPYGVATPNRAGFTGKVEYSAKNKLWSAGVDAALLSQVNGEGTQALTKYQTGQVFAELEVGKLFNWESRQFTLMGDFGMQNSNRSGANEYENIDLSSMSNSINLRATIFGDFYILGEYRVWNSQGFTLVEERNEYSQIIDFTEYDVDYSETLAGLGLEYEFTPETSLKLMWQNFNWTDQANETLPYSIDTWTLFFNMRF